MNSLPIVNTVATGQRIKSLRKAKGLKVEDISEYLGFTGPQAVYKWQRGDCLPEVSNLWALSRLFEVTIEDILVEYEEADEASSIVIWAIILYIAFEMINLDWYNMH